MPKIYVPSEGQKRFDEFLKANAKYIRAHGPDIRLVSHIEFPKVGAGGIWVDCPQEEFDKMFAEATAPWPGDLDKKREEELKWWAKHKLVADRRRSVRESIEEAVKQVAASNTPVKLSLWARFKKWFK